MRRTARQAREVASAIAHERIGGRETILVIDDDRAMLTLVSEYLRGLGYKILAGSTGCEGLEIIAQQRTPIHALVTDLVLPDQGGVQLGDALHQRYPTARVVYMSGLAQQPFGSLAEDPVFLRKPFGLELLGRTLRRLLDEPHVG